MQKAKKNRKREGKKGEKQPLAISILSCDEMNERKKKKNSTSSLFLSFFPSLLKKNTHQAFIWQLAFAAPASALPGIRRSLALDDRVLRSALLARSAPVPKPPTTAAVAKEARRRSAAALAESKQ